jgi:hypothetical protein
MKSLLPPELQAGWNVRDTVSRRERMAELAFAGYEIPRCGEFMTLQRIAWPLVVYTDEYAHCGEGKVLWKPGEPQGDWPGDAFCSEFVGDPDRRPSQSLRNLVIGGFTVNLTYQSDKSWASNVNGEFLIHAQPICRPADRDEDLLPYPMYAVDMAKHEDSHNEPWVAFDLNVCPGVPFEVVNAVGRDVLTESVARFCRYRGLIS